MTKLNTRKVRAVKDTLYLLSIPGMRDSIRRGLKTPVRQCASKLKWSHDKYLSKPLKRSK